MIRSRTRLSFHECNIVHNKKDVLRKWSWRRRQNREAFLFHVHCSSENYQREKNVFNGLNLWTNLFFFCHMRKNNFVKSSRTLQWSQRYLSQRYHRRTLATYSCWGRDEPMQDLQHGTYPILVSTWTNTSCTTCTRSHLNMINKSRRYITEHASSEPMIDWLLHLTYQLVRDWRI